MTTELSQDLLAIIDLRKTAMINNELLRLHIDVAALQETRLADLDILREKDFTFWLRTYKRTGRLALPCEIYIWE